jgi:hypothetical protein
MSTLSWDMMPYSQVEIYRCFGETYCLHLQGRTISQASTVGRRVNRTHKQNAPCRNADKLLKDFTKSHPIRPSSSYSRQGEPQISQVELFTVTSGTPYSATLQGYDIYTYIKCAIK